ncbi:MAG: hypothetical protein GF350_08745 [Chitinivibrionales bacterium]|nr:hypothetical protein [Chitinivibrionales bacterium]
MMKLSIYLNIFVSLLFLMLLSCDEQSGHKEVSASPGNQNTVEIGNYVCMDDCSKCWDIFSKPAPQSVYDDCREQTATVTTTETTEEAKVYFAQATGYEKVLFSDGTATVLQEDDHVQFSLSGSGALPGEIRFGDRIILGSGGSGNEYIIKQRTTDYSLLLEKPVDNDYRGVAYAIKRCYRNEYGFDAYRDDAGNPKYPVPQSYISLKIGGFTSFKVAVRSDFSEKYEEIYAKIKGGTGISFKPNQDAYESSALSVGDNNLIIFEKAGFENNYEIEIWGRTGTLEGAIISATSSEKPLAVYVHEEKNYFSYQIYNVNSAVVDEQLLKENINDIIKQGVIRINDFNKTNVTDDSWDKNDNGTFDHFKKYQGVNPIYIELFDLLTQVGEFPLGCYENEKNSLFILDGKIRTHWVLTEDANVGDTKIYLNSLDEICTNCEIEIGPWFGQSGIKELVYVWDYDESDMSITVSKDIHNSTEGIEYEHFKDESFWFENEDIGFTFFSCSIVENAQPGKVHAHEFLHQDLVGALNHVEDKDNIMFPYSKQMTDTRLRHRPINLYESGVEQQWEKLKR